jgi:LCP family protein required for cell wall assembly
VETNSSSPAQADSVPEARAPSPPGSTRSPLVAAALSFVFPGVGQLYLGRRVSAAVFAIPALVAIIWAGLQLSQGPLYFALSMLDDSYALTVMIVAVAFTAWRVASIVHPFLVARPRRIRPLAGAVLSILLIATVGMGDVVASNAFDVYNADRQIASNDFADPTVSPGPSVEPGASETPDWVATWWPSDTPEPTPSPGWTCPPSYVPVAVAPGHVAVAAVPAPPLYAPADSGSPSPSPTVAPEVTPSPTPDATPVLTPVTSPTPSPTPNPNRVTILLVGVDFISGRHHALTDTLMLVSVDVLTRKVAMVSVPRDTANFPFYWGGEAPVNFKINNLANAISAGRFGSPDPPMITLANEIGYLVGVKVNYYAEIDMAGFSAMIDLVGGVDINNPSLLNDPSTCTRVPAGLVHLDGAMALKYARSRESTNDYYRASRQQLVLMALRKKLATPAMLPKLGSLLNLAGQSIATNFPLKTVKNYIDVAEHINAISNCVLGPPYNYHPDSKLTGGSWTSRLKLDRVANLSVQLFGTDSTYYGRPGVTPVPCQNHF